MREACWLAALVLVMSSSCQCRPSSETRPAPDAAAAVDLPDWLPLQGLPVPGHEVRPETTDSPVRKLTREELVTVARTYHPVLDPEDYTSDSKLSEDYWATPEYHRLAAVQKAGIARIARWRALCKAVREALPPGYAVEEMTYPWYDPTYRMVIHAPRIPGSNLLRHLVIHMSYLVPYYFVYERHVRQLERFLLDRGPERYQVTPVHEPSLLAAEHEIARRYGYWRMTRAIADTPVPGIYVWSQRADRAPSLFDALFTPDRL